MSVEYRHGTSPSAFVDLEAASVAAVITDPPYGTGAGVHQYGRRQNWGVPTDTQFIANDTDLSQLESCAPEIARVLALGGVAFVFCSHDRGGAEEIMRAVNLIPFMGGIQWDKGRPGLSHSIRYCHEQILLCAKDGVDPFANREPLLSPIRCAPVQDTRHPNEKPVALLRKLIRWALPAGGLVLDPFAGIASCGVAAVAERCDYIGVECDEQWWAVAERRLNEVQNKTHPDIEQDSLFAPEAA